MSVENKNYRENLSFPQYYCRIIVIIATTAISSSSSSLSSSLHRAHGASSLEKGWMEVMMGRRCAEKGAITVDDTDHIIATNWLFPAGTAAAAATAQRYKARRVAAPLVPLVLPTAVASTDFQPFSPSNASWTARYVAPNVHLLSFDRVGLETDPTISASRVLIRLHHIFQQGETGDALSRDAQVNMSQLLPQPLKLTDVVELPLNGIGDGVPVNILEGVNLHPLQTRTFEATVGH
jgi:hypothetical protein